ncbi:MAG: alpha/beta hydrolase [Myxococcales bacterium]|nr:alpha/beta hydrolase [Myxococcales bacterium]
MIETRWKLRGMWFAGLRWEADPEGEDLTAAGSEPTVSVFLHGYLEQAGSWEGVAQALPGLRIALDQRGHGRSDHNPPGASYLFADYVADVDALLDAVSPDRAVRLVGHSMGGTIATLYAGARPARVASVVCLDGLGLADGVTGSAIVDSDPVSERMVRFLDGSRTSVPQHRPMPDLLAAAARLQATHPRIGPDWARRLAERGTSPAPPASGSPSSPGSRDESVVWSFDPVHRVRSPIPYRHAHHIPLLRRVHCPVLSLHPQWPVFDTADVALLEREIPDVRVETIPNTSHMMPLEEPASITARILAFWRATAPAPGFRSP